ncbi:hypothetical protein PFMALIP_05665 [Plasmodium falciparum MaliPS096_E11]|uniref:Surface antigen n=1 Tax=Plasmodium falciparum MaliPS096_E11 TaxID=1036727 RepID=A0A024WI97_PLAFA|nr:hypothetical protein PFMALIP_05665 [Plasmodium falciparum MaliPS096_E11]
MKIHYINILLFALPLNILEHNKRNHNSTTPHTPKIPTTRSLCECELYAPANYDSVPQMKEVMNNFNKQAQRRFQEYDDRMIEKRKQCKEQCAKEIQKIILKDKLEKQMEEQLTTLETKIGTDDIPTCICEKSVADKTEKVCLNCGKTMGAVAPSWGLLSGLGYAGWSQYVATTVAKVATDAGVKATIEGLIGKFFISGLTPSEWTKLVTVQNYANEMLLKGLIRHLGNTLCGENIKETGGPFCLYTSTTSKLTSSIKGHIPLVVKEAAEKAATAEAAEAASFIPKTFTLTTTIIASVVAIVVIVLVMVIIYLILRYRRKKKMKKKLQYIKLLKE